MLGMQRALGPAILRNSHCRKVDSKAALWPQVKVIMPAVHIFAWGGFFLGGVEFSSGGFVRR
jgi:hypothetical protein